MSGSGSEPPIDPDTGMPYASQPALQAVSGYVSLPPARRSWGGKGRAGGRKGASAVSNRLVFT
jgi:hypothetical protein